MYLKPALSDKWILRSNLETGIIIQTTSKKKNTAKCANERPGAHIGSQLYIPG